MDNLYSAPQADLNTTSDDEFDTYNPQFFSVHGRIGRLRYLGYSWLAMFVLCFFIGIVAAVALPAMSRGGAGGTGMAFLALLYIPVFAVALIMAKRRLNDLDHSGWLSILMLIPLLNFFFGLYLIFGSGTEGSNNYGPAPAKNSTLLVVGAIVFPIVAVFFIGILAAVAIPSYQKYQERARSAAAHQTPAVTP